MAVTNVSASGNFGDTPSAYGNYPWGGASASAIASTLPATAGTVWAVWQIGVVGVPAGQVVNGINVSGPFSFGVSGGVRKASLYVYANSSFNPFTGSPGVGPIAVATAGAAAVNVNYNYSPVGLTSDNLANGTFYLGFAVQTDGGNAGAGNGTISLGTLSWTIYTAPDQPIAPPGSPSCRIINVPGNINPGVFPGSSFAAITCQLLQPVPQSNYATRFDVQVGQNLTFADSGTTGILRNCGTVPVPADPHRGYSGLINIAANAKPGWRTVWATVSGLAGSSPTSQQVYTEVYVRSRTTGYGAMLSEV